MNPSVEPCVVSSPEVLSVLGTQVQVLLDTAKTGGLYTAYRCTVPPAGGPPPHRHDFDEAFYILDGTLEILCDGETHTVKAGEMAIAPRNAPHTFRNATEAPATYLGIATPAGHERFFEEASTMPSPFEVSAVIALCERHGIELLI